MDKPYIAEVTRDGVSSQVTRFASFDEAWFWWHHYPAQKEADTNGVKRVTVKVLLQGAIGTGPILERFATNARGLP